MIGRLKSTRLVRVSVAALSLITIIALIGPVLSPNDARSTDLDNKLSPPSIEGAHFFGTDVSGRDLFVRTLEGTRLTLMVAVVASFVSLLIGVSYGAIAGYLGGRIDALMMRFVDTLYAMPFIFFAILLMIAFGDSLILIFVAIGAVNWLDMARIVRGQTLSLKEREFVAAARLVGVPTWRIIVRHITPSLVGVVVVYLTLTIPQVILVESFLSFLGLGVTPPRASLGSLVDQGRGVLVQASWVLLIPSTVLFLILLAFNFLGDGLRDVVDIRSTGTRR